jgi:hypothetical protein
LADTDFVSQFFLRQSRFSSSSLQVRWGWNFYCHRSAGSDHPIVTDPVSNRRGADPLFEEFREFLVSGFVAGLAHQVEGVANLSPVESGVFLDPIEDHLCDGSVFLRVEGQPFFEVSL